MRTMAEHDLQADVEAPAQQDVTLGLTALVGIFLAVVLVCAVFFGFGYSTGRTLHAAKSASTVDTNHAAAAAAPAAISTPAVAPKPSAAQSLEQAPPATEIVPQPEAAAQATRAQRATSPSAEQAAEPAPLRQSLPVQSSGLMVQIAAVVHQADADALAGALRRDGFSAVVRTEPQDHFLHVQVGPYATRDQAREVRARLQAAGYNAFMKP